jgi:3-hydroxybutyryl-CoA dehydrogenase
MAHFVIDTGGSRSFPDLAVLREGAATSVEEAELVIIIGTDVAAHEAALGRWSGKAAVLVELDTECLGVHTGESRGEEGSNVLGFARFRLGKADPSSLVELVRQPGTDPSAIAAATQLFEAKGLKVALCLDFAGRIIDRLVRPYYNAALRRLDEQLATADDLDATLRLGLGYPEGPIALLERTGLAEHYAVSKALFEAYGEPPYAPARRAAVAAARERKS